MVRRWIWGKLSEDFGPRGMNWVQRSACYLASLPFVLAIIALPTKGYTALALVLLIPVVLLWLMPMASINDRHVRP